MEYTDCYFIFFPSPDSSLACFCLVILFGKTVNVTDGCFMQK